MPRNSERGMKGPGAGMKDPRVVMRAIIGVLLVANLAVAVVAFRPFGGSADDLRRDQQRLAAQLSQLQARIAESRKLVDKMQAARTQGDQFMGKYFMDLQTASSSVRLVGASIDLSIPLTRPSDTLSPNGGEVRGEGALRLDALLFGETQSRVVITCKPLDAVKVVERAKLMGVPAVQIGKVGGDRLVIKTGAGEFGAPVTELHDVWWNAIARVMA